MNNNYAVSPSMEEAKTFIPKVKKASGCYRFFKRSFDIIFSIVALIVLSPFILLLAIINSFVCKGHPFYKDQRVGLNGKKIWLYKFQSMYPDAESHPEKYLTPDQLNEWNTERKVENDPRILPFGRFLRKTSLDELPQFLNILNGSLALVGPRAITETEFNRYYSPDQQKILVSCRPGLTGYWQVKARNDATYESGQRTRMEMTYFEKRGFFFDLGLVLSTIPSMFKHEGM
jgi:lipopolysaccharide/colanic/teichoic acid biosynthesis glycosyltransferase